MSFAAPKKNAEELGKYPDRRNMLPFWKKIESSAVSGKILTICIYVNYLYM